MSKLIIGSLIVFAVSFGCSGGGVDTADDGDSITQGHKRGGGNTEGGNEITVLARDLILNGTADNKLPTTTEDKGLIDVNRITFRARFFH